MEEKEEALYCEAIRKWGKTAQTDMAIEEMAELIHALCTSKRYRKSKNWLSNIHEGIADVQIMLNQLNIIFDGEDIIPIIKDRKLERLQARLEPKMEKR